MNKFYLIVMQRIRTFVILMSVVPICLCCFTLSSYSQNGCDNGDFENGDFTNWSGAKGSNVGGLIDVLNDAVIFTPAALPYGAYTGPPTNSINMVLPGTDPKIPPITLTHLNSNYAVRIGNANGNKGMDMLSKTFTVDASTSNFSFWTALVFQTPYWHNPDLNTAPFFTVRVRNSASIIVPGIGFTQMADASNPFFETINVFGLILVYKNWDNFNLDLSSLIGQQVTVEFIMADCNRFGHPGHYGHWAYAYIDDVCLGPAGSPTGSCSIDSISSSCDNLPLQVCGSYTLPEPPYPWTAGIENIELKIYQNGIQTGPAITNWISTANGFCFNLNASDFPAVPPDGFDFVATATFELFNMPIFQYPTKSSGTPGNGIVPGMNNDYDLLCDTSCLKVMRDTTYCDSTGTYIYEFQIRNNSFTKYIEQLEITVDSPQGTNYVVTMPSTINVPLLPPRTVSDVYKVKLIGPGAVAYAEVCYTLSAHFQHDDCPWCCYIENCIKLPVCNCAEVIQDSIYCVNGEYFYNFTLKNGTQYDVTKIQLTSPGVNPITFVPQTFHFNPAILPGQQFPNQTALILGGAAGMTFPVRIKLFDSTFECCYFELEYTLPQCDTLTLNLRSFIQGRYVQSTNFMIGDYIEVELRNNFSPYSLVETSAGFLNDSGNCKLKYFDAENGTNYYIVVKSPNTIETWSKSPGQSFSGDTLNFDFLSHSQAYGNNLVLVDSSPLRYGIINGDVNQDGLIDLPDVMIIFNDAGSFVTDISDLNGDGILDLTDLLLVYNNAMSFAGVIRP